MNPSMLDGTDAHWLMYSDWLEDNGRLVESEAIREETRAEMSPPWQYERLSVVGGVGGGVGGVVGGGVGGAVGGGVGVIGGGVVGGGVGIVGGGVVGGGGGVGGGG